MTDFTFSHGLHDLGNGCWAFLQPDGGWGWSNSGLIEDSGETLLVDTLFDLSLTGKMLAEMRKAVPAAKDIDVLVNTHANGDHTYGNQLVKTARIVASAATKKEMQKRPPEAFTKITSNWQEYGEFGRLIHELMGRKFNFEGIENVLPTETFDRKKNILVGNKRVELLNVGPAHTSGDTLVWLPDQNLVYTGDIIFSGGHPIIWAGPIDNWIAACDQILAWDVAVVVPGHGPVGDKNSVSSLRQYLVELFTLARPRFDSGMAWVDAAEEIIADHFTHWIDRERVFINVASLWREFSEGKVRLSLGEIYLAMGKWYWEKGPNRLHAGHIH
ncbi:MAG: MBL fold metallo-hydrolase [Rhodospirillaceae bacterium]|jgi:cyclase